MKSLSLIHAFALLAFLLPTPQLLAQVHRVPIDDTTSLMDGTANLVNEDTELSTLESLEKLGQIRRWITPNEVARIGLQSSDGVTTSLAEVVQTIRQSNIGLYQTAQRLPQALSGRPEWLESIAETDDAFVITSGVRMMVKDPKALAAISEEFRNNLSERNEVQDKWEDLSEEERRHLEKFFAAKTAKMPDDHPLATAAKKGPAALFAAIQEGYGEFSVTETIAFAKSPLPVRNGRIVHPNFERGLIDFRPHSPLELQLPNAEASPPFNPEVFEWLAEKDEASRTPTNTERQQHTHVRGEKKFRHDFIVGFSIGSSWSWERKWESWAGYFEVKLGAGYEFGVRFPMQIHGESNPTYIRRYAQTDSEQRFSTQLTLHTIDAGPAYYRQQGVPDRHVFDGKEFVLGARAYYRIKLRAFSRTWINRGRDFGFDYGQNLIPPTPGHDVQFHMEIPPQLTGTHFDYSAVSGSAQFGLKVKLEGNASIRSQLIIDRENGEHGDMRINFGQTGRANLGLTLPPIHLSPRQNQDHYRYGLRLSEPKYRVAASLTPAVRGQLRSHVPGFRKTFSTGWIDLNRFKLELGSATLTTHEGTRNHRDITIGTKEFEQFKSRPILPEIDRPPTGGANSPITGLTEPPAKMPPTDLIDESSTPKPPVRVLPGKLLLKNSKAK